MRNYGQADRTVQVGDSVERETLRLRGEANRQAAQVGRVGPRVITARPRVITARPRVTTGLRIGKKLPINYLT
jgi:hypothetical protein